MRNITIKSSKAKMDAEEKEREAFGLSEELRYENMSIHGYVHYGDVEGIFVELHCFPFTLGKLFWSVLLTVTIQKVRTVSYRSRSKYVQECNQEFQLKSRIF